MTEFRRRGESCFSGSLMLSNCVAFFFSFSFSFVTCLNPSISRLQWWAASTVPWVSRIVLPLSRHGCWKLRVVLFIFLLVCYDHAFPRKGKHCALCMPLCCFSVAIKLLPFHSHACAHTHIQRGRGLSLIKLLVIFIFFGWIAIKSQINQQASILWLYSFFFFFQYYALAYL